MKLADEDVGRSLVLWFLLPGESPIKLFFVFFVLDDVK
jgi:hypothetical protein